MFLPLVGIILAIALAYGVGILTGRDLQHASQERYQRYRYAPHDPEVARAALSDQTKPVEYREPCRAPRGNDESDLCAQWKAARAAESGALWAARTFWIGIGGLLVTAIGTLVLIKTVRQAERSISLARTIGEAQTRAYLTIETIKGEKTECGAAVAVKVKNSGQSPALAVQIVVNTIGSDNRKHRIEPRIEHQVAAQSSAYLSACYIDDVIVTDCISLVVNATVAYADVFGSVHRIGLPFIGRPNEWVHDKAKSLVRGIDVASYYSTVMRETKGG